MIHISFSHVDNNIIRNEIYSLNTPKASPQTSIPASIMKEIFSKDVY